MNIDKNKTTLFAFSIILPRKEIGVYQTLVFYEQLKLKNPIHLRKYYIIYEHKKYLLNK